MCPNPSDYKNYMTDFENIPSETWLFTDNTSVVRMIVHMSRKLEKVYWHHIEQCKQ